MLEGGRQGYCFDLRLLAYMNLHLTLAIHLRGPKLSSGWSLVMSCDSMQVQGVRVSLAFFNFEYVHEFISQPPFPLAFTSLAFACIRYVLGWM